MNREACITLVKEQFSAINWAKFEEMDEMLNFDLYFGTAHEYYSDNPGDHYTWKGYSQAVEDMQALLEPLPDEMWFDCDGECIVTETDPEDYEGYWEYTCGKCGEFFSVGDDDVCVDGTDHDSNSFFSPLWVGGEWEKFKVRQVLMFKETYNHIF